MLTMCAGGHQGKSEKMIETGRICVKAAGRDAGKKCVVVDIINDKYVLIAGETRNRKVNVKHLEPTRAKIPVKKGASKADISKELKKAGIEVKETKAKKTAAKPIKQRKSKKQGAEETKKTSSAQQKKK